MGLTITEALAEIKTTQKRISKKREFVIMNVGREGFFKDVLAKHGGSDKIVKQELQAVRDLEEMIVKYRSAINKVNQETMLDVHGRRRSIADWIIWRREVSPGLSSYLSSMSARIEKLKVASQGHRIQTPMKDGGTDEIEFGAVIYIDEKELADDIENLEMVLGSLDGQLSKLNATTIIEL